MATMAINTHSVMNAPPPMFDSKLPFTHLKNEARAHFEAIAPEVSRSRGEMLFVEGETPRCVFVILSGRVKLSVSSREGRTAILRVAGPGEILGISAAMSGSAHETTAEAAELCRVKAIRVSDFLQLLQQFPEASAEATSCLLREYRVALNNVCRLALPNTVAGRLASLLLEWLDAPRASATNDRQGNDRQSNDRRFIVALTQEEIASMTNTSRETVSRVLHQFQQDKLIRIKGASVTILQPQALELLAV
ncbi:MAG TPA: Crp/Fnr family transcriptional regulator [Candidatus Angelobacter sp.]|nr:Crp/Fnr family transcriptional regulator [Candidatus Angelobacter sp.]